MAIQDLILRSVVNPPLITKGSELSYSELDGNFIELYNYLTTMNDGSNIAPFDIGATYSDTEYVSYNGNIYVHVSPTSTTGVLPDSDPTKWQLTSIGALAHQQNKDSYLAFGTANQVSATDLADILNNQVINITYTNFITAKNNGTLKINRLYCITNTNSLLDTGAYVNAQIKLYIRTIANSKYSNKGLISFVAPNYSSYSSYDYTYPYLVGDKVAYGLYIYECTSAVTNGDIPSIDTAHWAIKSYLSFPSYYIIKYFDVDFSADNSMINVFKVYDNQNNTFGQNDFLNANIIASEWVSSNDIDTTSYWNNISGFANGTYNNKLIHSSAFISKGGYNVDTILNNFLNRSVINCDQFMNGSIYSNHLTNVNLNLINGNFAGVLANLKIEFAAITNMQVDSSTSINGGYMNEQGSNIYATLDITGAGGVVDLESELSSADIYGEFRFDCASEMIETIIKANYFCPIVLKPNTSHGSITIKIYNLAGAASDNFVSSDYSGNIDLFADNNDYCIIERINIGGTNYWNVTKIVKVN